MNKEKFYIFMDNFPIDFEISTEIGQMNIKQSFMKDFSKKELKKGVFGVSFSYFVLLKDQIQVSFVTKGIKKLGRKTEIGLADGYHFFYQYSCITGQWTLNEVKH